MAIANKDTRERAVEAYKTGVFTQQELANAYCVHYKTIQNWLKTDTTGEPQEPKQRGCRPRVFSKEEEVELMDLVRQEPSITLENIKIKFKKSCHVSVIHRTLLKLGITYKKNSTAPGTRSERSQSGS